MHLQRQRDKLDELDTQGYTVIADFLSQEMLGQGAPGADDFDALLAATPDGPWARGGSICAAGIAALFDTGGTTGAPKLAMHTHGNQLHSAFGKALIYGGTTADVILNGFPLCHVASAFVFGLSTLLAGGCVALPAAHSQRVTTPASLLALTPFSICVTLASPSFCRPEMTALRTPSASRLAWQVSSKSQL